VQAKSYQNQLSLSYESNKIDEKSKTKQNNKQISPEMVIKIREIRPKMRGRLRWEGFMEKVSFESSETEMKWCIVAVVMMMMMMNWWEKDEMTVTGTHHRQVGEVLWEVHSMQRQGEAWRKERLLTFKEEWESGWARVTTLEERSIFARRAWDVTPNEKKFNNFN